MEMSQIGLKSEQTFFHEIFFLTFRSSKRAPRSIEETEFFAETNFLRHRRAAAVPAAAVNMLRRRRMIQHTKILA